MIVDVGHCLIVKPQRNRKGNILAVNNTKIMDPSYGTELDKTCSTLQYVQNHTAVLFE